MSGRRKNRPFYYAIKKDKLDELPIHDLLDMMRYDSAIPAPATQIYSIDHVEKISGIGNLDNIDSILDECYLFVNDVGPHLARWSSFGIRGKGAVIHCEGHSIWFQGKRPVYFIVKRDHFDKYELNYISGNEMADREELFKILWQDKPSMRSQCALRPGMAALSTGGGFRLCTNPEHRQEPSYAARGPVYHHQAEWPKEAL